MTFLYFTSLRGCFFLFSLLRVIIYTLLLCMFVFLHFFWFCFTFFSFSLTINACFSVHACLFVVRKKKKKLCVHQQHTFGPNNLLRNLHKDTYPHKHTHRHVRVSSPLFLLRVAFPLVLELARRRRGRRRLCRRDFHRD